MRTVLLSLIVPSVLLSSCANVRPDYSFEKGKPVGLIVGSVSYESGLGRYHLIVVNKSTSQIFQLSFGCSMFPCIGESANDDEYSKGETPKQRGGGYVVEVPEGLYRIVGWRVQQGYINSRSKAPVELDFIVSPGAASYLGNLHFDAHWEHVTLRDRSPRDLPLLKKSYAVLQTTALAHTIAPNAEVVGIGGEYRRAIEGAPIFIPFVPIRR